MELSRRRYRERDNCWHVLYGDVHVGTISIRPDVPVDVDQWGEISKTIFWLKLLFENLRSAAPGGQAK
jgi:hypothetical protein